MIVQVNLVINQFPSVRFVQVKTTLVKFHVQIFKAISESAGAYAWLSIIFETNLNDHLNLERVESVAGWKSWFK